MEWKKVEEITRHIARVQQDCLLLAQKLHGVKKFELSRQLIANGQVHDNSKFTGIEWDYLGSDEPAQIAIAVRHHNRTNLHHPEAWDGGIKEMPSLYVAEMVCDWRSRSAEKGKSLMDWIDGDAKKRFKFTKRDKIYEELNYFVNLLVEPEFQQLPEVKLEKSE